MKNQTVYRWNEEDGIALCNIYYNGQEFIGKAKCAEADRDKMNERIGMYMAETRALIKYFQFIRDCELRPQLKILNNFYYSINKSKQYNENSYENRMLRRQIRMIEFDLATIKEELARLRKNLKDYIEKLNESFGDKNNGV